MSFDVSNIIFYFNLTVKKAKSNLQVFSKDKLSHAIYACIYIHASHFQSTYIGFSQPK